MTIRCLLLFLGFAITVQAQKPSLSYYLPDVAYADDIPVPEGVLGFPIGEQHLSHDQQYFYMKTVAEASERITLTEYARSYEGRPLVYLTITHPDNHARLEDIRQSHEELCDPDQQVGEGNITSQPVVIYQGYSVHGNEASGGNAAALVAYYLAAAQSAEVEQLLKNAVILLDPCFNPDGFHRFSTWVNMHKNEHLTSDPNDREYDEPWPGGRTNHYWFDLNRDWLPVQHPESRGRIRLFQQWKPNILTDHHEMGTNSTFFFMPGIPSRTNPLTPDENQELTGRVAEFHAKALDEIGSLYYSKESFDDFYYGKGSTYPDANGSIGILFEQASARGHLQESSHGLLSFPFAIRNQVRTSLSTQQAALAMRESLLRYQRDFYRNYREALAGLEAKAFVFGSSKDPVRTHSLARILVQHDIRVYKLSKDLTYDGRDYSAESAFVVPLDQPQARLIRAMFEKRTQFEDSLFYDVSAWTLPLAFDLPYAGLGSRIFDRNLLGEQVQQMEEIKVMAAPEKAEYAYLLNWADYKAPAALYQILANNLNARVARKAFTLNGEEYEPGTVVIPVQQAGRSTSDVHRIVQAAGGSSNVEVVAISSGLADSGIDLGSPSFSPLRQPKVALLVGEGMSGYESGEVWHLLDQRYGIPVTKLEIGDVSRVELDRYNVIVMVNGSYRGLSKGGNKKLAEWSRAGGLLIGWKRLARWINQQKLGYVGIQNSDEENDKPAPQRRAYSSLSRDRGAKVLGGAIVKGLADLSHPLCFGLDDEEIPLFKRGTLFFKAGSNPYAAPIVYADEPLMSGYIHPEQIDRISGSPAAVITGSGSGRIVCLADNPNFRAFWYGTNRLFANALFFGHIISSRSRERPPGKDNPQVEGNDD